MASALLTTTSGSPQTWSPSAVGLQAGDCLVVEAWGPGSGGSGSSTSFRAGGAGGAYAKSPVYVLTPDNIANGVPYTLTAGGAGTGAANSGVGTNTSFASAANLVPNSINLGAVVGTVGSGGVLPIATTTPVSGFFSDWRLWAGTCNVDVVNFGIVPGGTGVGLPFIDIRLYNAAPTASDILRIAFCVTVGAGLTITNSVYHQLVGGSLSNIDHLAIAASAFTAAAAYVGDVGDTNFTPASTMAQVSGSGATGASTAAAVISYNVFVPAVPTGAIDITIRFAGAQFEIAGSATAFKSTPGFTIAAAGSATSGTTGGVGGLASACTPTNAVYTGAVAFSGGSGATRTQGGGGGGSAGKDGAGGSSTTATGGTGDNGSGGAANTSNVEGGGGGTAATTANAGGAPGGGGGAATTTNNGAAGGRGQIRLTWLPLFTPNTLNAPMLQRVEMIAY